MRGEYELFVSDATTKSYAPSPTISYNRGHVGYINDQLRALRTDAGMSQKEVAAALGMAPTTYISKEDPAKFKGPYLPVAFARKLAAVYAQKGIDPARVTRLTGAGEVAVAPQSTPQVRVVDMAMALPSVERLAAAIRPLIDAEPDAGVLATTLAERLPGLISSALSDALVAHPVDRPKSRRQGPTKRGSA